MKCEKCQDRGITEEAHGLVTVFCDCEAGEAKWAEMTRKPESKEPRELKPSEYFCTKCHSPHRKTSRKGKRHLKYEIQGDNPEKK